MAIKKPAKKPTSNGQSEAVQEASKEKIKLFNIKLPESKHTEFKALTVKNQDTMQEVLTAAIEAYLDKGINK